jgi:4-carboxymuconolactone decarboxylase
VAERFRSLPPEELTEQQRALYDAISGGPRGQGQQPFPLTDRRGALTGPFGIMLIEPGIGAALQDLGAAIRYRSSLSTRIREIAILTVAAATSSTFETWAHERVALAAGMATDELDDLRSRTFVSGDAVEQAAYNLVEALLRRGPISEPDYAVAAENLDQPAIFELCVLVGYYQTLAMAMHCFDVGPPEEFE